MIFFLYTISLTILFTIYLAYIFYDELLEDIFILNFTLESLRRLYRRAIIFRFSINIDTFKFFDAFDFNISLKFNLYERPNVYIRLYFVSVLYNLICFCMIYLIRKIYILYNVYSLMVSSPYWGMDWEALRDGFRVFTFLQYSLFLADAIILYYTLKMAWWKFEYIILIPFNMFCLFIYFCCFLLSVICKITLYLCFFLLYTGYGGLVRCSIIFARLIYFYYFLLSFIYKIILYLVDALHGDAAPFFNILYRRLFCGLKLILWDKSSFLTKVLVYISLFSTFNLICFLFYSIVFSFYL